MGFCVLFLIDQQQQIPFSPIDLSLVAKGNNQKQ